jgi:hypothetical protein
VKTWNQRWRRLAATATAVALALPLAGGAEAAQRAGSVDNEEIIRRGVELRRKRDEEGALREFRRAYEMSPTARAAAQMGLAERSLHRWVDAEAHLAEALAAREDPWIRQNRKVLEAELRLVSGKIGRVEITGEPAGAEVVVNTRIIGRLPLPAAARVEPGSVRVELRSPGYTSAAMTVKVNAGQTATVDIKLDRERTPSGATSAVTPPAPAETPPAPAASPSASPLTTPAVETPPVAMLGPSPGGPGAPTGNATDAAARMPSPGVTAARWVTLGATGLFLASGIAGLVTHEGRISKFNAGCELNPATGQPQRTGGLTTDQECRDFLSDANTGKTVAIVGFAGAGLLAVTSALLFFAF